MIGLKHHQSARLVALCVALGLGLVPQAHARAGSPVGAVPSSTPIEDASTDRFAPAPPEPTIETNQTPVPPPTIDDTVDDTTDIPVDIGPRIVDHKRPISGTGLITMGSLGMAASLAMAITAMAGPGWLNVDRDDARIVGIVSLPLGLFSIGAISSGANVNKKYRSWATRNHLKPPKTGTGMLIGGAIMTAGFGLPTIITAQRMMDRTGAEIDDWIPTAMLGSLSVVGVAVITGGMFRRSKFTTWERAGYIMPGTMALEGGAGVALSGRF